MENALESASQNDPLDRLYSHYNQFEPIAILSVDTPDNTAEQNQENLAALTRHLSLAGFLYHRIQGEYTDRNKQTIEDTHTVIIYAYPDRQKELEKFTLSLGKGCVSRRTTCLPILMSLRNPDFWKSWKMPW